MLPPDDRAKVWYVRQQRISRSAVDLAGKAWGLLNGSDLTTSWNNGLGAYIEKVLTTAQVTAAAGATSYTSVTVSDAGLAPSPAGTVNPAAFGGVAADGRPLADLLYLPIIEAKQSIALGNTFDQAMASGLASLLTYVDTEVADASRAAVQSAISADTELIGYTRYLVAPSCSRCIILAGQLYRHSTGFQRHPRCDCQMRPMTKVEWDEHKTDVTNSPTKALASMSRQQLSRAGVSQADQKALAEGADPGQVINAKRHGATYVVNGRSFTREGTTRKGLAGQRLPKVQRLTVAQIYREAGDSRTEAVRLLKRFGYLL